MKTKLITSQQKLRGNLSDRSQPRVSSEPPGGLEAKDTERRLRWIEQSTGHDLKGLPLPKADDLRGIIENHVGFVPVPMSVAAPLVIHGDYARGEFVVPLCTLESALTPSVNRGLQAIAMAGGCRTVHLRQELSRSPAFCLPMITEIDPFLGWINDHAESILAAAESTTRHGRLLRVDPMPIQHWVVLDFVYDTGNAAGQNMVTTATEAACKYIQQETGFHYYLESGISSDHKPSRRNLLEGRGHAVTVEFSLDSQALDFLGVTPEAVLDFQQLTVSSSQAIGMLGNNLHLASALAALYLATGQDAACVAENAVAFSQASPDGGSGVQFRMTLPSLTVGTVGGGARLPVPKRNLDLLGCGNRLHDSRKLAEIIAACAAALELSVLATVVSGTLAESHRKLARAGAQ
jgi:hydroxymethylglutaryl-CoA reductase (NADPH)